LLIRRLEAGDWPGVAAVYEAGIATGHATFETAVPSWKEWNAAHLDDPRLVADRDGRVVGWAAISAASSRPCYAGVVENSVYVAPGAQRQGVGRALLERLVADAVTRGIWTIQTSIFPENVASVALHIACGYRLVGRRDQIARLNGEWRDTLLLERRSKAPASTS
jgi:L-amino acid N-acyltransferase YncA